MTTTAQVPAAATLATTTTTAAPIAAPLKRPGWGEEFCRRLLGPNASSILVEQPAAAPTITVAKAAGLAVMDAAEVGVLGGLFGTAHARGMLDVGRVAVDGVVGLLALAASVAAAPQHPLVSRGLSNLGLSGIFSVAFRKSFDAARAEKPTPEKEPPPAAMQGEDPIAKVAREIDL